MYLKSIEMSGFKSFPDRVKIEFGEGMTGIVGPNGSGKSNISDAIRWVLGEQSTKLLRGNRMEDVIFSGTEKRRPLGMAEVSLTFDNTARFLRADRDEVTVTRRYFRSGDSDYLINKKNVRLRDVTDLFLDTGLGRDGYSIIGQGRIDEVLSQRSEDRREIFEEAAGIARYRSRKDEAERKLAGADENLTRINDIIAELEAQLDPMKRKAERARSYLAIHAELRELETDLCGEKASELKAASVKARGGLEIAETVLADARTKLARLEESSAEADGELAELDKLAEEKRASLRGAENTAASLKGESAVCTAKLESAAERARRLKAEGEARDARATELDKQLSDKLSAVEAGRAGETALNISLNEAEAAIQSAGAASAAAGEAVLKARSAEGARREAASSALERAAALKASASELELRGGEYESSLALMKAEHTAAQAAVDAQKATAESLKERSAQAENSVNALAILAENREARRRRENDELMRLRIELGGLKQRSNMLAELEREYEGYSKAVKLVMQAKQRGALTGIDGTVGELITVSREHALALETALGAALSNVVTETEEDARGAIELLKRQDAGRATFLPVSAVRGGRLNERGLESEAGYVGIALELCSFEPKYGGVFASLLGRTVVTESLDAAIGIARRYSHRFRIVTEDGQVINAGGSMTGGSVSRQAGVLTRAAEKRDIDRKALSEQSALAATSKRLEEAERLLAEVKDMRQTAEAERASAREELAAASAALEQSKKQLDETSRRLELLSGDSERSDRRREETAATLAAAAADAEDKRAQLASASAEVAEAESEKQKKDAELSAISEKLGGLRIRLAALKAAAAADSEAADELRRRISSQAGESEAAKAEEAALAAERAAAEAELERLAKEAECAKAEVDRLEREIAEATDKRMAAEARRSSISAETRRTNDLVVNYEREKTRLELQVESNDSELMRLSDRLWESYELTIGEATANAKPIPNRAAAEKRAAELKTKRRALGEVDVGAIDEYKSLSERYDYLSAQRDDAERSAAELRALIAEIVAEMSELFAKSFNAINENFGDVFREIFGGGTAELALTDPTDALASGIEIRVQPPGKSLKLLSLLSGGERALVAIALYFAILRVQPSPFCVLDEIDAALDELNVARFAAYVKKINASSKTQFIVMTHRRGTMEAGDKLFGVTMQEQGVSRLIPIDMDEIERKIEAKEGN